MLGNKACGGRALRIAVVIAALVLVMAGGVGAVTITVDDSGGGDYTRIQDAINNAAAGDTIEVYSGTYFENVNVNKQLILRGIGMPVVDARVSGSAITLAVDGIMLEGFTAILSGSSPYAGIKVISNNNKLIGNNASNNYNGIDLSSSSNNTLNDNNVSNNNAGIHLSYSNNNILNGNNAISNPFSGIFIWYSSNNTLSCNNASNNNLYGIYLYSSSNNTLSGNNATSNNHYGVVLYDSSNYNILSSNNVSNNGYGISLSYSINNIIYNNIFNNTNNFEFSGSNIDIWNITRPSGTNIIGGYYLGGNFWAKPDGSGFSQTCADADGDGICDSPYSLDSYNIDYLPLSMNFTLDITPPKTISNLNNISYSQNYINWTWIDPADEDFDKVMIYLNGYFQNNITKGIQYYNATGLIPDTIYDLSTRTVDIIGNINTTWVNHSARTAPAVSRIITVDDSGGADYTRIQDAIDSASAGDTILVYSGAYYENVAVNKRLVLRGEDNGAGIPKIEAGWNGNVVFISSNGVTIDSFIIERSGGNSNAGIYIISSNNSIKNNNISKNSFGIYLSNSNNNTISNNNISTNVERGLRLSYSNRNKIINNYILHNFHGIELIDSSNNTLSDNNASSNTNKGIRLYNSLSNELSGNYVTNNTYSVELEYSSGNTIFDNYFKNHQDSIPITSSTNKWNITKTLGTNIIGGTYFGGNFWSKPDGSGFSQTCEDVDADGICDYPFTLDSNNIDYQPLAVTPNVIVDSDFEDDPANHTWNTIQEGIDNANASDVIYVRNGTYKENIAIYKPLILIGEDNNNTVIDGANKGDAVYVKANNVQISGFKIINGKSLYPLSDVEVRGEVTNGSFTWTPDNFGGFYYNVDEDIGNETLKAVVSGRDIYEGNLIYTTTPQEVSFDYDNFGSYQVIGSMADKYFAGYTRESRPSGNNAKSTLGGGQLHKVLLDDDEKRTVLEREIFNLEEGYSLKVTAVDIGGGAGQVWITLLKDGSEVDSDVVAGNEDYYYTKTVGNVSDLPVIAVHIDSVFRGKEINAVFIRGVFQISEAYKGIKTGDQLGVMQITAATSNGISMENNYSIYLSKDSIADITGNLKFKVADSDLLRFHPFVKYPSVGSYEIRGKVAKGSSVQTWDAYSFSGFYFDLNQDIKPEKLSVEGISGRTIKEGNLTYQTYSAPKYFNVYKYKGILVNGQANYSIIGWLGEKNVAVKGKANKIAKELIEQGAGATEKKTLTAGEIWDMGDGWTLTPQAIDAKATPRQVWLVLSFNGVKKDDIIVQQDGVYTFVEKSLAGESDVPVFVTYVDSIFAGAITDMVQLRFTWAISPNVMLINSGDEFGKLKVVNANQKELMLKNNYAFSLNPGSIVNIIGDVNFKVADFNELRYYPAVTKTITWESASGIKLDDSVNSVISGVNILNSSIGIHLYSAKDNQLVKNGVSADYIGVDLTDSFQNVLSNNTILSKVYGIKPEGYDKIHFNNSIDTSNKLNGKPVYYYFNAKNITLDGIDTDHLTLAYSTGFKIRNSTVGGDGTNLYYSESNIISNNTFGGAGLNSNGYEEFSGILSYETTDHYNLTRSDYKHYNESLMGENAGFSDTPNKQYVEKLLLQATVPITVPVPISGGGGGGGKGTRINLYHSYYNNITGNTLLSIVLDNSYSNIVTNNNAPITLYNSGNNVIDGNNAFNNSVGIYLWDSSNNSLAHNNVLNNLDKGIFLDSSCNNTMRENNAMDNNWDGISLWFSSNNTLIDNNASNNKYYGIDLYNSDNNTLTGNAMSGNTYNFAVAGDGVPSYIQNIDASNKVDGKPVYYLVNQQNRIIDSTSNAGYAGIINSTNITLKDLTLKNNSAGILFIKTNNSNIENATVSNNSVGIYLFYSYNNSISRSNESYNSGGLVLRDSDYNTILNNTIFKNWRGVSIDCSSKNTIKDNYLWNNSEGILIYYWSWGDKSSNNLIYHNNFITNTQNAIDYSYGDKNLWNATYPTGGNYWSDYTGSDADGDGFGDTPYNISYDARDYYPLMKPLIDITPPTVTNQTATPPSIPDDTDSDPRWGETSQLNVTITDESGVAGVTINLSALGKSAAQPMALIAGSNISGVWSVTTNASAGKAGSHNLTVNAADIYGNSNTSVKISLRVLNNGDVNQDGAKTLADAMYLAKYVLNKPGFENAHLGASEVSGDGSVTLADAMYLAKNILNKPGFEVLH